MTKEEFMNRCLERLGESAEYNLPLVEDYVFAVFKARELAESELGDEPAVVKIAPRLKGKPDSEHSNPKIRMWALYRKEANELGKLLGLINSKPVRAKKKKAFEDDSKMRLAK